MNLASAATDGIDCPDDWEDEDDREEDEEDQGLSMFAFEGFGPVCLRFGCEHWGGDGLCDLAIGFVVAEETGSEPPKGWCPLEFL